MSKVVNNISKKERPSNQAPVYGSEKEAWRREGHYFSHQEFDKLMEQGYKRVRLLN